MVQDKGKLIHSHPANELTEKLFGIESVVNKIKLETADNTTFKVSSDKVPAGKIWKITRVSVWNRDGDIAAGVIFALHSNGDELIFYRIMASIAQYVITALNVELYLDTDDIIRVTFTGVGVGERVYVYIFGYEMNAP